MVRLPWDRITYDIAILILILSGIGFPFTSFAQDENKGNGDAKVGVRTTRRQVSSMTLEEIRASLKRNPDDALLYYRAGFLEEQEGNLGQALRDYQEAIKLKARIPDSYYRMGIVWEKTGEFYDLKSTAKGRVISGAQRQKAIDAYRAAIRVQPDFADAYYRLSLVYLVGDDMREANETYQKLHQIEPDTDRTKQLLLMIYKRHQQQSRSRR